MRKYKSEEITSVSFVHNCNMYHLLVLSELPIRHQFKLYDCLVLDSDFKPVFRKNIKNYEMNLKVCCMRVLDEMEVTQNE